MATYVMDAVSKMIREELAPTLQETLPQVAPVFEKMLVTSMGVTTDGIGRDWKVLHSFATSLAGGFEWSTRPTGPTTTQTSSIPANPWVIGSPGTFPNHSVTAHVGIDSTYFKLVQGVGNLHMPLHILKMDQLSAPVANYVKAEIEGAAKLITNYRALAFFLDDDGSSHLSIGKIGSCTDVDATKKVKITLDTTGTVNSGRIRRFFPGMFIDILDADSSPSAYAKGNSTKNCIVDSVDYLGGHIYVATVDGGADTFLQNSAIAAGDLIVPRALGAVTTFYGPFGLIDWIKESGTIGDSTGGIALATHPQYGSLIGDVSGALTEEVLNKYMAGFHDAGNGPLDTFITTQGAVVRYLEELGDQFRIQRGGQALAVRSGWTKLDYTYDGREMQWLVSPYSPTGVLWGLKMQGGNWKRYVPPAIPGASKQSGFPGEIEFVAPLMGSKSIFKPTYNSSGNTQDVLEAPFWTFTQTCPTLPMSLKLTNLTETTI